MCLCHLLQSVSKTKGYGEWSDIFNKQTALFNCNLCMKIVYWITLMNPCIKSFLCTCWKQKILSLPKKLSSDSSYLMWSTYMLCSHSCHVKLLVHFPLQSLYILVDLLIAISKSSMYMMGRIRLPSEHGLMYRQESSLTQQNSVWLPEKVELLIPLSGIYIPLFCLDHRLFGQT